MMKLFFTFALVISIISSGAYAQNYIPFPDSGAIWVNVYSVMTSPPPIPTFSIADVEYYCNDGSDTIINLKSYNQIYDCNNLFAAGIRDDGSGTVYVIPKDSINEFILYDFSAQPGDTLVDVYCHFGPAYCWNGLATYYVNSVDSVLVGNTYRKRLYFQGGGEWIEGIGNLQGLFWESGINVSNYGVALHCLSINDSMYDFPAGPPYNLVNGSCSFDVGIDDDTYNNSIIQIYPNPAENILFIITESEKNKLIELYDAMGKLIYSTESIEPEIPINMESLENGMYFIYIHVDEESLARKIIKI